MPKYTKLPPITGKQLIKLLPKDGWIIHRRTRHGVALIKAIGGRTRITIVQDTRAIIPERHSLRHIGSEADRNWQKGLVGTSQ